MTYLIHSSSGAIPLILVLSLVGSIALFLGTQLARAQEAIVTTPPGSTVESIRVAPIIYTHLDGTWTYYNSSSHASGQITFTPYETTHKFDKWGEPIYAFIANINGKTFTGSYDTDGANFIDLCHKNDKCDRLQTHMDANGQFVGWGPNHLELQDDHNDIIHLMRIGSPGEPTLH